MASAVYQIEGGAKEGGRGESIWDVFSHTPDLIKNDDTGNVAAENFHRWREDVKALRDMGLKAYVTLEKLHSKILFGGDNPNKLVISISQIINDNGAGDNYSMIYVKVCVK